ncbi:PREDICTED: uncharacterized protein LOC106808977 [Priapulus caudatus]|uniref:Uncharacterized protein LOC106808977 n=1 Tax=Priapulus caudatus TaxID=37621 RepID=A0ABM1E5D0_PRICU|nr:PREDICTED: uncharacterized protein LOC106808977 [Priapulus caudatus]
MDKSLAHFPKSLPGETVRKHFNIIVEALWYIDGTKDKIQQRAESHHVKPLPPRFQENFNNYNDFKEKRKAAQQLGSQELKRHSGLIFRLIGFAFTSTWDNLRQDLEVLALSLDYYATFLENENQSQKYSQLLAHPVRQVAEHVSVKYAPACNGPIQAKYSTLNQIFTSEIGENHPVYFDENIHVRQPFADRHERYRFLNDIALSCDIDILRYDPGGGLGTNCVNLEGTKGSISS